MSIFTGFMFGMGFGFMIGGTICGEAIYCIGGALLSGMMWIAGILESK